MESPLNRPKEGQKAYDSGKKCHALKTPVLMIGTVWKSLIYRMLKAVNMLSKYIKKP
jgi:hypothetical protein